MQNEENKKLAKETLRELREEKNTYDRLRSIF